MPAPANRLKAALKENRPLYGLWLAMADAYAAEIAAHAGFDWLLVDGEHGPNDVRSIMRQLQVLKVSAVRWHVKWARARSLSTR